MGRSGNNRLCKKEKHEELFLNAFLSSWSLLQRAGKEKGTKQSSGESEKGFDPLGPIKHSAEGRTLGIFWHTQLLS